MSIELYSVILTYLSWLAPSLTGLAMLIFGILIITNPVKSTKVLGIGFVLSAVNAILGSANTFSVRFIGMEQYARFSAANSIIGMIISFLSLVTICVYIHKNYGHRLIYLPLLLIQFGGTVIDRAVVFLLAKNLNSGMNTGLWLSLVGIIDGFVISAVISIIIIVVFWKNKEKENVIPKTYLIRTICLLCGVIGTGIDVLVYLQQIFDKEPVQSMENLYMLNSIAGRGVALIFPVYVLIMVFKASKNRSGEAV